MERLHWLLERVFDEDINQLNQTFTAVTIISHCMAYCSSHLWSLVKTRRAEHAVMLCSYMWRAQQLKCCPGSAELSASS